MSATLNAGHAGRSMKSVTAPSRARSMRLPVAPPISRPVGSHTSGRSRWRAKNTSSATSAASANNTSSTPPPENIPNAIPRLRTLTSWMPRTSSTSSPRSIVERTSALAAWSAATVATATTAARPPGRISSDRSGPR
jgi:hypothetical protein